ncbi:hypothetical protein PIPA1_22970 [Pelosinus sp. IPA-1]|nr:hypothetical protein PIPA1_22970 [Pelosinus sp. IPA-1]
MTEIAYGLFIVLCTHAGFVAFGRIIYERKLGKKLDNKKMNIGTKPKWILCSNKSLTKLSACDAVNLVINELSKEIFYL